MSSDRNPSPPPELLELEKNSQLGDSVKDTVFSKHWLFSVIMRLIEEVDKEESKENVEGETISENINEDFETELCKLWDMSMNSEVAAFLEEFKAVDILMGVIDKTNVPRIIEIAVGILGNMACNPVICELMSKNEKLISVIILLLQNRDTRILVETTRLLHVCLSSKSSQHHWVTALNDEDVYRNIVFILQSSTNVDLLRNVGEILDKLLNIDEICEKWAKEEFVESLTEAVEQIESTPGEILDTYLHIYQLLSSSISGVQALVVCSSCVFQLITKYIKCMSDDDEMVVSVKWQSSMASAISVLHVLFTSTNDNNKLLEKEPELIQHLFHFMETIFLKINNHESNQSVKDNKLIEEEKTDEETEKETTKSDESTVSKDESQESILGVLQTQIIEFWGDIIMSLDKESNVVKDILKQCDDKIQTLLQCLKSHSKETGEDYITHLEEVFSDNEKYTAIHKIIKNFKNS